MLTIRLQRTGRSGHAQFRVVVQDSRTAPTSGKVIAQLGSYNPHTKETIIKKEEAERFMANGAQPSERIVKLFASQKIKMPQWVTTPDKKSKSIKNSDKLRRNQPAKEKEVEESKPADVAAEPAVSEEPVAETSAEEAVPDSEAVVAEEPATEA